MDDVRRSPAASQGRVYLALLAALRPHIATDRNLPARLQQLLAREKRFGSRDRRLYRELLYTALRHLPWIESALAVSEDKAIRSTAWLSSQTPATRVFRDEWTSGWPALPDSVAAKAAHLGVDASALIPAWFGEHCPASLVAPEVDVINTRAPLWVRLQTDDPAPVFAEFAERNWPVRPSAVLPSAFEVLTEADLTTSNSYQNGLIDIQDLGSQLLLHHAGTLPDGRWLDACAGAGGKTLQLARLIGSNGRVDAYDIRHAALDELGERARRARLANIRIRSSAPASTELYDGVLVDAPCSGTGTWRRAPHLKWCTTPATIAQAALLQHELLARFARHVRPGGLLVYATCSLSHCENEDIVSGFLSAHSDFMALSEVPARTLLPSAHNTDGYYVAPLRRR
ncbi:MAG TPA: RsmB/NOP family class I SAM-dependent RNA methyltransferase [Rariglobus sp.]|jgi:16S rRNA (cytosine967-C5)-methyltransferase|nr:RsmB/NOP family class I SAM-dependent RNA methyltransferase [Rariglobus sp.]